MRVLAADDDISVLRAVERLLRARGHAVTMVDSGEAALSSLGTVRPELILLDVQMPGIDGLETLERLGECAPSVPVIIMTGLNDVDTAVRAFKVGATDFVVKPFDEAKLLAAVDAAVEPCPEPKAPRARALIGQSPRFREVMDLALRFARPDINVLLYGETGTGKELFARAIHEASKRRGGPFVPVDCSALAESLIESELFGHEKGSFTGAVANRVGLFERANGGTLFLDEVGNLSSTVQAKLLRALQERTIERVGGREARSLDIRVIAAANVDLLAAAQRGTFRLDLYYRIAEATLTPPPLRERQGDVRLLAEHFVAVYAERFDVPVSGVSEDAMALLVAHEWPGNVRELENVIKHATALAADVVRPEHLPASLHRQHAGSGTTGPNPGLQAAPNPGTMGPHEAPNPGPVSPSGDHVSVALEIGADLESLDLKQLASIATEKAERAVLSRILCERRYSQAQLAKLMNIDPKTLRAKLRKYGLDAGSK
jgi:DNA-binding NtrC family response regulator